MAEPARVTAGWRKLWDLFHAALERAPDERNAFLGDACGSDKRLRERLEQLVSAHERQAALLDRPPSLALGATAESPEGLEEASGTALVPGQILARRFEIVRPLGSGGMGSVYEARDRELGLSVALKVLKPEIARDGAGRQRFHREVRLARRVTHSSACRIFEVHHHPPTAGDGPPLVFLTMELLPGRTLAEHLSESGPLPIAEALPIIEQIAGALDAAHRVGVVHRDLKAGNVMLVPEEDGKTRAVVTDFGLARPTETIDRSGTRLTRAGQLLGTPAHMAPEQLRGGRITPATDLYALGLLIYELTTGRLPFGADTPLAAALKRLEEPAPSPRKYLPELDRVWEKTILRCLERRPADRFQEASEVVAALQGRVSPGGLLSRRRYRRRLGAAVVALVLLAAVSLIAWQRISIRRQEPAGTAPEIEAAAAGIPGVRSHRVLICSFDNRTGEPLFDGTVEYALERHLQASRLASVVPRERIADALRLMKEPPGTPVDAALGREIALRDGGVHTLIEGRIEKIGSAYVVGVDLSDAESGRRLASLEERADDQEKVLATLGRLANDVRLALGEESSHVRATEEALAAVTTRSLEALRRYSQAEGLFLEADEKSYRAAAELLAEATAEDPEFASAHILLAWALWHQGRPAEECLPPAEAAFALSDGTPDRERHFIRGSYHQMRGETDPAIAEYRKLVGLYPDHFWGTFNLVMALHKSGEREEAMAYLMRAAELRPNDFHTNAHAAWLMSIWGARPDQTRPYVTRSLALATDSDTLWLKAWMRWLTLHEHWARGDVARVVRELDAWAKELESQTPIEREGTVWAVSGFYLELGQLKKSEQVRRLAGDELPLGYRRWRLDLERLDREDWPAHLRHPVWGQIEELRPPQRRRGMIPLLARAGLVSEARALLHYLPDDSRTRIARGDLALAEGRTSAAIRWLEQGVAEAEREARIGFVFRGSDSLARAWERQGDPEQARRVLERASWSRALVTTAKPAWMEVRLHLARLERELGRIEEARAIEAELRQLLAYADPDHRLVRELRRLEEAGEGSPGG